jgi:hypothetical protein
MSSNAEKLKPRESKIAKGSMPYNKMTVVDPDRKMVRYDDFLSPEESPKDALRRA